MVLIRYILIKNICEWQLAKICTLKNGNATIFVSRSAKTLATRIKKGPVVSIISTADTNL